MKILIFIISLFLSSISMAENKVVNVPVCQDQLTVVYLKNLQSNLENTSPYFVGPFAFKMFDHQKAIAIKFSSDAGTQALYGKNTHSRFKAYPLNKVSKDEIQFIISGKDDCSSTTKPLILVGYNENK